MASSSDSEPDNALNVLIKSKGKRKLYKCDIIKNARLKGVEYINYKGSVIQGKQQGESCG